MYAPIGQPQNMQPRMAKAEGELGVGDLAFSLGWLLFIPPRVANCEEEMMHHTSPLETHFLD